MKLLSHNKKAFTTIEMIITMLIVLSFMLLTIYMFHNISFASKSDEKDFWYSFQNYWNETIMISKSNHKRSHIYLSSDKKLVIFGDLTHKSVLNIPDTMEVTRNFNLTINSDGYISPSTIVWKSNKKHIKYVQTIQLGWGIYQLKEE